jgi:hypothetical protein
MQIYLIADPTQSTTDYVCDSQATIDAGVSAGYIGNFSIGTESDANTLLAANQQSWLIAQQNIFCANKNIITSDGYIEWITVNLDTEPANTDVIYRILNVPNGDWLQETGLNAAKAKFADVQQNYLAFSGLSSVTSWIAWPKLPS